MVTTNFPAGVTSFGMPVVGSGSLPVINGVTGTYWFVDSVNGSAGNPGTFDAPFAALATAISAAAVNDIIVLASGHAETISAAAGIAINKAGLQIIGLGSGSKRPTFTFATSTAATMTITAASVSLTNVIATTTVDQIVSPFVVSAADVTLGIEWRDGSSVLEALRAVLTTAAASRLRLTLRYIGFTGGTHGVNAVRLVGGTGAVLNLDVFGKFSTSVVEFATTATIDTEVYGYVYNSGTTDLSKNVVDTITGSTWYANGFDGAAGLAFDGGSGQAISGSDVSTVLAKLNVPALDATTNVAERDVIGNKTDTAVTAVGTTKSVAAYAKGLVTMATVQSADSTANAFAGDVSGNKTDASVYVPGTTKSIAAYAKGHADLQERVAFKAAAVLSNGTTIFTVTGGPIKIEALAAVCVVGGDAAAATLQYSVTPTSGSAQTISGASASVSNSAAGASVTLAGTALATAALLNANGPNLIANPGTIFCPAGTITTVIGSGPTTTGTWAFYLRYRPMATGVTVA